MKVILNLIALTSLFLFGFNTVFANTYNCLDLTYNTGLGSKDLNTNGEVTSLQDFLRAGNYLKVEPTGYFGNLTVQAVKDFQSANNIEPVGQVGQITKKQIKNLSCNVANLTSNNQVTVSDNNLDNSNNGCLLGYLFSVTTGKSCNTTQSVISTQTNTVVNNTSAVKTLTNVVLDNAPTPTLTSIDSWLFLEGGVQSGFVLNGVNFSTSSNIIYVKDKKYGTKYNIGTFESTATGTVISTNTSLTSTEYDCGNGCLQKIPKGEYEMTVSVSGKESSSIPISIGSFNSSTMSGSNNSSVKKGTAVKIGTVSFGSGTPFKLDSISASIRYDRLSGKVSNYFLKDESNGEIISNQNQTPNVSFGDTENVYAFTTKVYGLYADIDVSGYGYLYVTFNVNIKDFNLKNKTTFTMPEFVVTLTDAM